MAALGLVAEIDADKALRMLKKYLVSLGGPSLDLKNRSCLWKSFKGARAGIEGMAYGERLTWMRPLVTSGNCRRVKFSGANCKKPRERHSSPTASRWPWWRNILSSCVTWRKKEKRICFPPPLILYQAKPLPECPSGY